MTVADDLVALSYIAYEGLKLFMVLSIITKKYLASSKKYNQFKTGEQKPHPI